MKHLYCLVIFPKIQSTSWLFILIVMGLASISPLAAALNQKQNSASSPWFLFFTVLTTTIILAIAVLLIKLRLKGVKETKT